MLDLFPEISLLTMVANVSGNKKFSNQFDFYFPLPQIMVMNIVTAQRKIKIKLV